MAGKWEETTLADISADVAYGYTESASDEKVGPRFLRITDIQNGVVDWHTVPYCLISESDHRKYRLHPGDIVVARTGNSTGENYLYRGTEDAVYASYLIRFRVNQHSADPAFVWYNMRTQRWQDFINSSKTGSAQAGANAKVLGLFPLNLPPLAEQKAIAAVLGALDDKIELNRRMNATLEAMARALFQSWFVDFDPVRAKMEGRQPTGMDAETTALFPDSFQDSQAGHIPKGWEVCSLANKIAILSGGTPKTSEPEYWDGDIPWYSVKDAPSETDVWVIQTEKQVTTLGIENSAAQVLPEGTTIISARGTVGKLALVGTPMAMNQSCYGVRGIDGYAHYFTYFTLRQATADIQQRTHGTVFDTITRQTFETLDCNFPPAPLTQAFDRTFAPLLVQIRANLHQSRTLATLRDTLLPKLLSGEVSVAELEPAERNGTL
jgi:type I restriction enzyme S subunit